MAVKTTAVSVGNTATLLTSTATDSVSGQSVLPYNDGSVTVYLGGSDVTASGAKKGAPMPAGSYGPAFDLSPGEALYGIVASSTCSVLVTETGV